MELYINIVIGFFMFVIGTLFGSFFSLATYRIPRNQDILIKRSYCPICKHNLKFFDLIPILSYIFCGGKCRYCKEKISIRYPILELTNGVIYLIFFIIFNLSLTLVVVCIVYAVLFVLVGTLFMNKKIINKDELNKKRGVYITEIIIAMVLFTLFLISSYVISRNYNKNSMLLTAKSEAISLAIKNIETCKATKYDLLNSYSLVTEKNGVDYNVYVNITSFSELDVSYRNIVKKIDVSIKYNFDGNNYEYNLDTLKGKVKNDE